MSDTPFVPFYTSDFLAGTGGMTAASKGVYITLLCLMYESEAPLQQSWDTLARRCGCTVPAFRKAVQSLQDDGKLTVSDDGIWSDKCDRHIAQRRERQSSAKAAAKKRWKKTQEKQGKTDATASNPQCQPEPEPEPEPYVREDAKASSCAKPARDEGFAEFWAIWPDKKNKQAANKAWRKLSMDDRRAAFSAIRAGWFDHWQQSNPRAAPIHAATFLNQRRWEDQAQPSTFKAAAGDLNDKRTHHHGNTGADAEARIIAFAARAGRSPSSDCF